MDDKEKMEIMTLTSENSSFLSGLSTTYKYNQKY